VVEQDIQTPVADKMYFYNDTLLTFAVSDVYQVRIVDPTIFRIEFRYFLNASYYEVKPMRPCILSDVNGNQTLFDLYQMDRNYCLDGDKNFYLEGTTDEQMYFRYISVNLFLCDNVTSNNTCKSPTDIGNFFNSFSSQKIFIALFKDMQIDLNDYYQPFKETNSVEYQLLDPSVKKRTLINYKMAYIETDSGWMFPQVDTQSEFMYDSQEFDFQMRVDPSQPIYQFLFFSSKDNIMASRRYQTLSEFLGAFAGVSKFISIICGVFVNTFIYISTLKHILNKIYAFPAHTKIKAKKSKKTTKLKKKKIGKAESIQMKQFEKPKIDDILPKENTKKKLFTETIVESKPKIIEFENQMLSPAVVELKNSLVEELKSPGVEEVNNLPSLPLESNVLKKELKNDSFILEHFSDQVIPDTKKEVTELKKSERFQEEDEKTKSETTKEFRFELKKNKTPTFHQEKFRNEEKNQENMPKTLISKDDKMTRTQRMKKKFISFFKKTKEDNIRNKLHVSYWEYITLYFNIFKKDKSVRHKLIRKAENTYKEDMDVVNVVTKLHDLEKLKILLLDEDQLVLFNYLSKPIINLDNNDQSSEEALSLSQKRMTHLVSREKNAKMYLEESYRKILERKNDKLSEKLITLFDEGIYDYYRNLDSKTIDLK